MQHTQYWLMKSEPDVYSIDDLKSDVKTLWTGVRNFQARNFMMHPQAESKAATPTPVMTKGDYFIFYHSGAEPPACAGIGRISKTSVPDPEQFNKKSDVFEPKATLAKPIWFCAECSYVKHLARAVSLAELRGTPALKDMGLLKRGNRLSVQPLTESEFKSILRLSGTEL